MNWDVIIIGAGAAGLLAGARAAQRGKRTLLLEKNKKLGVKILMSGGTRCNITHHTDPHGIVSAFGKNGSFLHSALAALGPDQVVELMEQNGVATKVESTGKVFPVSDRALDVRDALVRFAERAGCQISAGEPVVSIGREGDFFIVATPIRNLSTQRLILTTGGKSYPGCGTTGDGYAWATGLGHSLVAPRPALTPILTSDAWAHELSGLTLEDVELTLFTALASKQPIDRRRGSFLFTHFGISGPVALDISGSITRHAAPCDLVLSANFLPGESADSFRQRFQVAALRDGKRRVMAMVAECLPKSLARALAVLSGITDELNLAELSKEKLQRLINTIFRSPIGVIGTKGFEKAEVTAGGVRLTEIDSRTMQSKIVPGLFFAGEILDLDGRIGGFNFQSAFSTGWLAGDNV